MMVVFTAALGETSPVLAPAVVDKKAGYVVFSDRRIDVPPYRLVLVDRTDDPKLASRRIKVLADHPALSGATALLWHDSSYRLLDRPRWAIRMLRRFEVVGMAHPRRGRLEDEAAQVAQYGYVTPAEAQKLVRWYRKAGYVSEGTITSGGLLGRRVTPAVERFNRLWWSEVERWHGRDQPSLDFAAWRAGIRVGYVPGAVKHNKYAAFRPTEAPA